MVTVGFDRAPTQSVILPNGSTAVVRVTRGNETRSLQMFPLLWSRVAWLVTPAPNRRWRVDVVASQLGDVHRSAAKDAPVWAESWSSRPEAAARAAQVFDELRRTGQLPGPSEGVWPDRTG